jgi:histidinol dehydrogenase
MSFVVRFAGRLAELSLTDRTVLLARSRAEVDDSIESQVRELARSIRADGDAGVRAATERFDGIKLETLRVPDEVVRAALQQAPRNVVAALERSAANLERVHRAFLPPTVEIETEPGVIVGRRPEPLGAVGVYAPGGRAAYPSSVLMGVVPARVAGVGRIVVCSPPQPGGLPSDVVLAAAAVAGASDVFAIGGAQAIFALAFGTASVPRVSRIVGPGNAYVAEAKRQVAGHVGIDAPAGPSEILIIGDASADPALLVRELLAQAEHDPEASCVALVTSEAVAQETIRLLGLASSPRSAIVDAALRSRGAVLCIDSLDEAVAFAEAYAAEHVLCAVESPEALRDRIKHAGTIFYGQGGSVAFGDYMTGANHVLPTAGAGQAYSGLSTLDFVRFTTYQRISAAGARALAASTVVLAEAEGLFAHADAARVHLEDPVIEPAEGSLRAPVQPRNGLEAITLYTSNRRAAQVDLSDNTNQRGAPPSAARVLAEAEPASLARYPSHYADELKRAVALHFGVSPSQVVTGCGSDDVIDCALRAFANPGDRLVYPDPTFAMIPYFARTNGLTPVAVPLRGSAQAWDADLDVMLAQRPKILYLCSPNNPTGTMVSRQGLERALAEAPGLVILDEAYADYAGDSLVKRTQAAGRLLVIRTLSKAFGLAGQRVGIAIGAEALVREIEKVRGPYKVNVLGERVAIAALTNDAAWVAEGVREVIESRERFIPWLASVGLSPLPSSANFVLVPVRKAVEQAESLRSRGIAVRPFSALPGIGDAVRISVGPWPMMEPLLGSFAEVLRCE